MRRYEPYIDYRDPDYIPPMTEEEEKEKEDMLEYIAQESHESNISKGYEYAW